MNLSAGEIKIIHAIAKGNRSQSEVAKATGLARRTIYTYLNNLEAMGIIVKQTTFSDMRKTILTIAN